MKNTITIYLQAPNSDRTTALRVRKDQIVGNRFYLSRVQSKKFKNYEDVKYGDPVNIRGILDDGTDYNIGIFRYYITLEPDELKDLGF